MAVECALCGCPFDDAHENNGAVVCECGLLAEGVDPEDIAWGFHLEEIPEPDDDFTHELIDMEDDQW